MSNYLDTHGLATLWGDIVDTFARKVAATQSENGLMSATDKSKLDGIANNANNYELPPMSPTTRGGAKLGSGLAMDGDVLSVALESESDGTGAGPIVELTAKGWATQDGTPSPDSPVEIQVARGRNLLRNMATSQTVNGVTFTVNADGSVTANGTATANAGFTALGDATIGAGTYTFSGCPSGGGNSTYEIQRGYDVTYRDYGSGATFTVADGDTINTTVGIIVRSGVTCNNLVFKPQLELGSTPTPYVPYGHVGVEAQGKNLIPNIPSSYTSGATLVSFGEPVDFDGVYMSFYFSGSFTYGGAAFMAFVREDGTTAPVTMGYMRLASDNTAPVAGTTYSHEKMTFISSLVSGNCTEIRLYTNPAFTNPKFEECVLNNSRVPMDYTPYYHSTTPIPLPSRGWVGALPDGTADTLTLDGAGKVVWSKETNQTTQAVTDGVTGTVGVDVLSSTGQIADGATVLYKLATPVTEDMGYVEGWTNDFPEGCVLSIPELDALNVRYVVDDAAVTLARQYYDRARSEYEDRIAALEEAVAEIVAG